VDPLIKSQLLYVPLVDLKRCSFDRATVYREGPLFLGYTPKMATEIKAIQCPKCGSTEKTELRLDHFRCGSCGTEYFLDNGSTKTSRAPGIVDPRTPQKAGGKFSPVGCFITVMLVVVVVAVALIFGMHGAGSHLVSSSGGVTEAPTTWGYSSSYVYVSADGRPIVVGAGSLGKSSASYLREAYVFFVDAITDSLLKSVPIPGEKSEVESYQFEEFSNGDLYLNADRAIVFQVDKGSFGLKDVTQTLGSRERALQSGIAQIQFVPNRDEDGFKLMTNDGRNLYYFPLVNKIYREKELWEAEKGMNTLLPSAVEATRFTFSEKSDSRDEDTIELVKYRFMDNRGGPKDLPWFRWDDRFSPPLFIYPKADFRCLSYTNFTPGRLYFDPKVLYSDSDYVLISFAATVAGRIRYVQCLNARTAAIVFTTRLDETNIEDGTIRFQGGFVCRYNGVYVIDMKGRLKKLKSGNE